MITKTVYLAAYIDISCVPEKESKSNMFGSTWGWVNDDTDLIFGWTISLKSSLTVQISRFLFLSLSQDKDRTKHKRESVSVYVCKQRNHVLGSSVHHSISVCASSPPITALHMTVTMATTTKELLRFWVRTKINTNEWDLNLLRPKQRSIAGRLSLHGPFPQTDTTKMAINGQIWGRCDEIPFLHKKRYT